jgi:aminopeptidase N
MVSDRDTLPDTYSAQHYCNMNIVLTISSVKPINYDLSLYDIEFLGEWSYQGAVKIELEIKSPAKKIVLNAHQLSIRSAALSFEHSKTEQVAQASNISYNKSAQRVILHFDQEFAVTLRATLDIKFQGTITSVSEEQTGIERNICSQYGAHGRVLPFSI